MDAGRSVVPVRPRTGRNATGKGAARVALAPRTSRRERRGFTLRKLLFVCLCWAGCIAEGEGTGRAVLVGTNVVSLGVYPGTEERTVRVGIRNDGKGELKIEGVALSCDCLRVDGCYPRRVAAGGTGEVSVAVRKEMVEGAFRRVFLVRTDDPEHRLISIAVEGVATPAGFRIVPDRAELYPAENEAVRQFLIVLDGPQPPDSAKLKCRASVEGVSFRSVVSKGGNGFLVDAIFSKQAMDLLRKGAAGYLACQYSGQAERVLPVLFEN